MPHNVIHRDTLGGVLLGHLDAPFDGIGYARAVRELRHRHINKDVTVPAEKSQCKRVIAQARVLGTPCGHIGQGVACAARRYSSVTLMTTG